MDEINAWVGNDEAKSNFVRSVLHGINTEHSHGLIKMTLTLWVKHVQLTFKIERQETLSDALDKAFAFYKENGWE